MVECLTRGRGFKRHCLVALSKKVYPSLVLVQPRKTRPWLTERLLMGHNQIKQSKYLFSHRPIHLLMYQDSGEWSRALGASCFAEKCIIIVSKTSNIIYKQVSIEYWKVESCFWSFEIKNLKNVTFLIFQPMGIHRTGVSDFFRKAEAHCIFSYHWILLNLKKNLTYWVPKG